MLIPKHFCIDIDNVIACTDEVMRQVIEEYTGGRVQLWGGFRPVRALRSTKG